MSEGGWQLAARGSRLSRRSGVCRDASGGRHVTGITRNDCDSSPILRKGLSTTSRAVYRAPQGLDSAGERGPLETNIVARSSVRFGLLLSYLIYIGAFLVVFGGNAQIANFVAYVSIGMLVFMFLQEVMLQSVLLFAREESFIAGTTLPFSVYVMRLTMQSVIRSGYSTLGCLGLLFSAELR